jgi:TatA/E family protein of Tat protein translocase
MFGLGFQEVLLLLLIALLLFGAKRLPEAGRSLGKAISEFKKAMQGEGDKPEDADKKQP